MLMGLVKDAATANLKSSGRLPPPDSREEESMPSRLGMQNVTVAMSSTLRPNILSESSGAPGAPTGVIDLVA